LIRPFRPQDLSNLIHTWRSASQIAHPFLSSDFLASEESLIASQYLPHSETWVFAQNDQIVGFISLLGSEIGALFVHGNFHRQGIGQRLLQHVQSKRETLLVEVFKENWLGRRFYKKHGFTYTGEYLHEGTGHIMLKLTRQTKE
jgi:putative acetyltransferase